MTQQFAPATQRNREPILGILQQILPPQITVLEIASGTGEHGLYFAPRLAPCPWLPTDPNPLALASIAAWQEAHPVANFYPPVALDVEDPQWPLEREPLPSAWEGVNWREFPLGAIVAINLIHISPWSATLGLLAGAGRLLPPGGVLYLYGPYREGGEHTAASNAAFDASLRSQDPRWGVRDREAVVAAAEEQGFQWQEMVTMPANNRSLIFRR
jgi:SAM-dependent methyltransferase